MADATRLKDDIVAVLERAERPLTAAEIVLRTGRERPGRRITAILLALRRDGLVEGETNGSGRIRWSWVTGANGGNGGNGTKGAGDGRGNGTSPVTPATDPPAAEAVGLAWAVLADWFRWIDDELGQDFVQLERGRWRRLMELVERRELEEEAPGDVAAEAG